MNSRRTPTMVLGIIGMSVAGCGGEDDSGSGSPSTTSTAVATSGPNTTAAPTSTHSATWGTAPPDAVGMIAELEVLGGPDWLAADDQGVWVKLDNGSLVLIDPSTNAVADTIDVDVGGELCQGLGAGDGAIWACAGSDVARVNPDTRSVFSVIPAAKTFAQGELAVADGQVWVLTGDGSTLEGIDATTQHVWSRFPLPIRGTDLGVGEAGMWVVSTVDDAVINVNLDTGKVLETVAVSAPVDVAVESEVWVGAATETVRIDAESGTIGLTVPAGTGPEGSVALTPREVWVRNAESFLTRINRQTGEIVESFTSDVTSGGDVLYAFGSIWTSAFDDERVFRFAAPA